jgi:hypothetical protein
MGLDFECGASDRTSEGGERKVDRCEEASSQHTQM